MCAYICSWLSVVIIIYSYFYGFFSWIFQWNLWCGVSAGIQLSWWFHAFEWCIQIWFYFLSINRSRLVWSTLNVLWVWNMFNDGFKKKRWWKQFEDTITSNLHHTHLFIHSPALSSRTCICFVFVCVLFTHTTRFHFLPFDIGF